MLLSKKFIIWLWLSIFIITLANILSFYFFYSFYIKLYFYEKTQARDSVTIDYINDIIKKNFLLKVSVIKKWKNILI